MDSATCPGICDRSNEKKTWPLRSYDKAELLTEAFVRLFEVFILHDSFSKGVTGI